MSLLCRKPSCSLPNGIYAKVPCREWYFHCQNGVIFENVCPGNLIFNEQTQQCDFRYVPLPVEICSRSNVAQCNGGSSAPPPATNLIVRDEPAPPPPPSIQSDFCLNRQDAQYADGCNQRFSKYVSISRYIVCTGGMAFGFVCQQGLVFNEQTGACDFSTNVALCSDFQGQPQTLLQQQPITNY